MRTKKLRLTGLPLLLLTIVAPELVRAEGVDTFNRLLQEIAAKTVYVQDGDSERCPKYMMPAEFESHANLARPGDRSIYLSSQVPGKNSQSSFTHEGNQIYYRPGLREGTSHTLFRDLDFVVGLAYSTRKQRVENDVLSTRYSAKVGSLSMIGSSRFEVDYDASANTIRYFFSGSGVDDVNCLYKKAGQAGMGEFVDTVQEPLRDGGAAPH